MKWLLALDLGTDSLGWWAYKLKKEENQWAVDSSLDGGVRLFPDSREPASPGRVGDSLAVNRRVARGMRRNREARHWRLNSLVEFLIARDLLPEEKSDRDKLFQTPSKKSGINLDSTNPYFLRAQAVEEPLCRHLLGRALAHLAKRRGFKSNRKDNSGEDKEAEKEASEIKAKINRLDTQLAGQTLGQYLWTQYQQEKDKATNGPLDQRPQPIRFRGSNEFFANRQMYADEFDRIRATQALHLDLSDEDWDQIRSYVLDQRPLRPVERGVYQLLFFHNEPRHWADTPVAHSYRIYQELNNLKIIDHNQREYPLSDEQRQAILEKLDVNKEVGQSHFRIH